jgi:hypothetical protein
LWMLFIQFSFPWRLTQGCLASIFPLKKRLFVDAFHPDFFLQETDFMNASSSNLLFQERQFCECISFNFLFQERTLCECFLFHTFHLNFSPKNQT